MSDITYTIGAKDQASAPMKKVESSMDRLEKSTKKLGETSKKSLAKVHVSFSTLAKATGVSIAASAAIKGLQSAYSSLISSVGAVNAAYDEQTEAVKGLETALRLNGESVEDLSPKFQAFASEMQALTGVGDEVTLGLMKQASMMGISADQLDDVAKSAIGLAEATGKDLNTALKMTADAMNGNFSVLKRSIPAIASAATEEEKLAAVQALASRGLEAKAESADRLAGMVERAQGALGDMREQFGALLAPIRMVAATGVKYFAEQITELLIPATEWVKSAFERMKPVFDGFRQVISVVVQVIKASFDAIVGVVTSFLGNFDTSASVFATIADFMISTAVSIGNGIIKAVTFMEVIFTNFGSVVHIAIDSVLLSYESYRADTEHLFVTALPAYVSWFADNFFNIIETAFNAVYTVITNNISKIIDTMKALWDWIASAGSSDLLGTLGEIAGRSYLEGFESSIGALPEIAERALTDREKQLQDRMGKTAADLANQFNEKFESRKIKLGDDMKLKLDTDLKLNLDSLGKNQKPDGLGGANDAALKATEGRLLARGPGSRRDDFMRRIADASESTANEVKSMSGSQMAMESEIRELRRDLGEKDSTTFVEVSP